MLLTGLLCSLSTSAAPAQHDMTDRFRQQLVAAAAQGDLSGIVAPAAGPAPMAGSVDEAIHGQFLARFVARSEAPAPASGDPFVDSLVTAYRDYWVAGLLRKSDPAAAQRLLEEALAGLLSESGHATDPSLTTFDQVSAVVRQRGYYVMMRLTPPLLDLYVWRTQERVTYQVEITDRQLPVTVAFMDGFVVQGWSEFASLGLDVTSGWAGPDELYCVRWIYDPASENFRVSYLKHEARHLADYRMFPELLQGDLVKGELEERELDEAELEYRAKLTELAFAGATATALVRQFAATGEAAGTSAHALANRRVAQDIYRQIFGRELPAHLDAWSVTGPERINPAARALLARSTARLREAE